MRKKKALLYILNFILVFAGFAIAGILSLTQTAPSAIFTASVGTLSVVMLVLLFALVVIEVVSVFKVEDSTVHTVYIAVALLLYFLTSFDTLRFFDAYDNSPSKTLIEFINYFFLVAAVIAVLYFLNYNYRFSYSKITVAILAGCSLLSYITYIILYFFNLQYIAYLIFLAVVCLFVVRLYYKQAKLKRADLVFHVSTTILYAVCGMGLVDILGKSGVLTAGTVGYCLMYMFIIVLLFAVIYISHIVKTEKAARLLSDYKLLYERTRTTALRGQIKPHFVFNLLSTIKTLYRINPDEGDRAINLFSMHLRANVMAAEKDLIPFEKELDYIEIYIELENLRQENKFNVIYDIDCTDFEVPILGLQPYIENSIKYSCVNEKPDGVITIASHREDENIVLTVSDNGVGFDTSAIGDDSYGIKNSLTRFELLLGAKPQLTSRIGEGTKVIITIPSKNDNRGGVKQYEDYFC